MTTTPIRGGEGFNGYSRAQHFPSDPPPPPGNPFFILAQWQIFIKNSTNFTTFTGSKPSLDPEGNPYSPPIYEPPSEPENKSAFTWVAQYNTASELYWQTNSSSTLSEAIKMMAEWFQNIPDIPGQLLERISAPASSPSKLTEEKTSSSHHTKSASTASTNSPPPPPTSSEEEQAPDAPPPPPPPQNGGSHATIKQKESSLRNPKRKRDTHPPSKKKKKWSERNLPEASKLPSRYRVRHKHQNHVQKRSRSHYHPQTGKPKEPFVAKAEQYYNEDMPLKALHELKHGFDKKTRIFRDNRTHRFAHRIIKEVTAALHDAKIPHTPGRVELFHKHKSECDAPGFQEFVMSLRNWGVDLLHSMATLAMTLGDDLKNPAYYQHAERFNSPILDYEQSMRIESEQSIRVQLMIYQKRHKHEEEELLAKQYLASRESPGEKNRIVVEAQLLHALLSQKKYQELIALFLPVVGRARTACLFGIDALASIIQPSSPPFLSTPPDELLHSIAYYSSDKLERILALLLANKVDITLLRRLTADYDSSLNLTYTLVKQAKQLYADTGLLDRAEIVFILFRQMASKGLFDSILALTDSQTEVIPDPDTTEYRRFMHLNSDPDIKQNIWTALAERKLFSTPLLHILQKSYKNFELHLRQAIVFKRLSRQNNLNVIPERPGPAILMEHEYLTVQESPQYNEALEALKDKLLAQLKISENELTGKSRPEFTDTPPAVLLLISEIHLLLAKLELQLLKAQWSRIFQAP